MNKEGQKGQKDYTLPVLFSVAIALTFVFLVISVVVSNSAPSVRNGATTKEVGDYAHKLLESDKNDGTNTGYLKATEYYLSQIQAAKSEEQEFNLTLDLAIFYGETGDPTAGLSALSSINADNLPLDARYYLYSTYIYLYERSNNDTQASYYRQKIEDEGINEYFANLDNGVVISPEPSSQSQPEEEYGDGDDYCDSGDCEVQ